MGPTAATGVCVVGGGPAGATVARQLAVLGHEVCLVEAGASAGPRIGETFPPSILPLLDSLALRERIVATGVLRPRGARIRWGDADGSYKRYPEPGLTVDRERFDKVLRVAAGDAGAKVLDASRVTHAARGEDGYWHVRFRRAGAVHRLMARFLVDATGRRGFLARRRSAAAPQTLALFGYGRAAADAGEEARVEACEDHWVWGSRLPHGRAVAAVFLDPRARRRSMAAEFHRRLAAAGLLRDLFAEKSALVLGACNATAVSVGPVIGDGWIRVGDAATRLDPLSSQGVQRAMQGALHGAVAANTLLRTPDRAEAVRSFYAGRQADAAARDREVAAAYYRAQAAVRPTQFWRQRGKAAPASAAAAPTRHGAPAADRGLRLCPSARIGPVPVLDGDLIAVRTALTHPALREPVAFVGPHPIELVVDTAARGGTLDEMVSAAGPTHDPRAVGDMLLWLWRRHILI